MILANGQPPKKSEIAFLRKAGYDKLICADGGANSAYKLGLIPDYIIGDLDSANPEVIAHYTGKSIIKKNSSQYSTDVEKCLTFAIKNNYKEVILLGATGDRLDHSFCNLGIVIKFYDKIRVNVLHQKTFLTPYNGKVELNAQAGETISIYGIDRKTKITTQGLKYPINKGALPFGELESTSNEAVDEKVILNITGGVMFVIREFKVLRKNGFFFTP